MSREGLSMRKAREILRLRLTVGLSIHRVARICKVSSSTVSKYERRFRESGLSWPLPEGMDDAALERVVWGRPESFSHGRPMPDLSYLMEEMRRPHVTLSLLWLEYKEANPEGYQYTQFCHYYRQAAKKADIVLRQEHRAGEKVFTDYAGSTLWLTDPRTGHKSPVYLFVAVLGASNYTFAEGVTSLDLASWIGSHVRAFEFFGGVPRIVVPDNTKCAVSRADRYEPEINREFADMAAHYGTAVIPARVRRPRDKAKVEKGVQIAERWIIAVLRNRTFFSLAEVNEAISELLDRLNSRRFKMINSTRAGLFERLDSPALSSLPQNRYQYGRWSTAKVNIDYHIVVERHFYSVPHQLVGAQVDVRTSAFTVEILYKNRRVASHIRSYQEGGFTTNPDHMPASHREHLGWSPSRIISWAEKTGPNTSLLVKKIMESRPHPQQGYRSCLGIIRLSGTYTKDRVEAAAARALRANATSYRSVKSILEKGLDKLPLKDTPAYREPAHTNIRGRDYYSD